MTNDQAKDDLEWLLTRLGWRGDFYWDGNELGAFPPYDPTSTLTEEQWFSYGPGNYMDYPPRFDQYVNLMIELVGALTSDQLFHWQGCLINVFISMGTDPTLTTLLNAPAHHRLRAYRMVMEDEVTHETS